MNVKLGLKIFSATAMLALLGGCFSPDAEPPVQVLARTSATGFCPKLDKFYGEFASRTCESAGSCVDLIYDAWEPMLECLDIERPEGNTPEDLADLVSELVENVPSSSEAAEFAECVCGKSTGGAGGEASGELNIGGTTRTSAATSQISNSSSSAAGSRISSGTSSAAGSRISSGTSSAANSRISGSSSGD